MRERLGRPWLGPAGLADVAIVLVLCAASLAIWWRYGGLVNGAVALFATGGLVTVLHEWAVSRGRG